MKKTCNVDIRRLSRVEGHGNIRIKIKNGKLMEARWEVVETPRFFEAILKGKKWDNAPWITGRICGICSIGHTLTSIRAVENAFGIIPDEQTKKLRLILKHMETLQSHTLHLSFLVLPDFMKTGSVFPLIKSHEDVVLRAARIKKLANDICDCVGGRRMHPTRTVVGGFTMLPEKEELRGFGERLKKIVEDLMLVAELVRGFSLPDFVRETEFVSLKGDGDYPFIGGDLVSSDGVRMREEDYKKMTNEYMTEQSTSKWCRLSRESFAVGALARLNNNFEFLHPAAREVAGSFGLTPVNHNPFMNNIAQLVECVHVVKESTRLIDELLDSELKDSRQKVIARSGIGVAAVEVPRGILYHSYEFDDDGRIVKSDCVILPARIMPIYSSTLKALLKSMPQEGKNRNGTRTARGDARKGV